MIPKTLKALLVMGIVITAAGLFCMFYGVSQLEWEMAAEYGPDWREKTGLGSDWPWNSRGTKEAQVRAEMIIYPYSGIGVFILAGGLVLFIFIPAVSYFIAKETR